MTKRRGATRSSGLVLAIAITYLTVILASFAAGYLVGRLLL